MTTYFTSDLHLGHRLVAGIRGFWEEGSHPATPDVTEHMIAIKKAWSVVKPDDIVWILGDVSASDRDWTKALQFIRDFLPGRKRLVCGNHDPVSSIHRDAWKYQRGAIEVFETVQDFARVRIEGGAVLLSHYPYSGTGSEGLRGADQTQHKERYTEFRLPDVGMPLLHGHTHGPEKLHFSDAGTPQVHIGLDAWNMQLVPEREVAKLLDTAAESVKVDA